MENKDYVAFCEFEELGLEDYIIDLNLDIKTRTFPLNRFSAGDLSKKPIKLKEHSEFKIFKNLLDNGQKMKEHMAKGLQQLQAPSNQTQAFGDINTSDKNTGGTSVFNAPNNTSNQIDQKSTFSTSSANNFPNMDQFSNSFVNNDNSETTNTFNASSANNFPNMDQFSNSFVNKDNSETTNTFNASSVNSFFNTDQFSNSFVNKDNSETTASNTFNTPSVNSFNTDRIQNNHTRNDYATNGSIKIAGDNIFNRTGQKTSNMFDYASASNFSNSDYFSDTFNNYTNNDLTKTGFDSTFNTSNRTDQQTSNIFDNTSSNNFTNTDYFSNTSLNEIKNTLQSDIIRQITNNYFTQIQNIQNQIEDIRKIVEQAAEQKNGGTTEAKEDSSIPSVDEYLRGESIIENNVEQNITNLINQKIEEANNISTEYITEIEKNLQVFSSNTIEQKILNIEKHQNEIIKINKETVEETRKQIEQTTNQIFKFLNS